MNKYTNVSQEEMLAVCCIINSEAEWYFNQLLDNDGKGTDDCYEFLSDQEDIVQFNIHQIKSYDRLFRRLIKKIFNRINSS